MQIITLKKMLTIAIYKKQSPNYNNIPKDFCIRLMQIFTFTFMPYLLYNTLFNLPPLHVTLNANINFNLFTTFYKA